VFQFILRRLLVAIPVLIGVTLITFILVNVVPGDPVLMMLEKRADQATIDRIRHQMGLDRPLPEQYLTFLVQACKGDLGESFRYKIPVTDLIKQRFPVTIRLATSAMLVALVIGLGVGILSAVKQYSVVDHASMVGALALVSAPIFWVAILSQIVFGLNLKWLPISGYYGIQYMVLPALVLGVRPAAGIARLTRSSMLEVIRQDYIRTARAKGLAERPVIFKHALKNALIPVVTVIGLELGGLLTGSILTETVFGIPGLGRLAIEGITYRDFPVIQGTVLFTAVVYVLANIIVDISYAFLDPRIRLS
jgi:peptide/nickel transport system permease protein